MPHVTVSALKVLIVTVSASCEGGQKVSHVTVSAFWEGGCVTCNGFCVLESKTKCVR